jgi:hypothetical protein
MGSDLDSGDTPMTEESGGSTRSTKKHKKSTPGPPDEFVGVRIKLLKTRITGLKGVDNAWTQTLRDKLDSDTVNGKFVGDRTFKTNQQWVTPTHGGNKEGASKWSWYGVLFMLVPFGMLSGKQEQYPSVWDCVCTKGYRKVYQKKTNRWNTVKDRASLASRPRMHVRSTSNVLLTQS